MHRCSTTTRALFGCHFNQCSATTWPLFGRSVGQFPLFSPQCAIVPSPSVVVQPPLQSLFGHSPLLFGFRLFGSRLSHCLAIVSDVNPRHLSTGVPCVCLWCFGLRRSCWFWSLLLGWLDHALTSLMSSWSTNNYGDIIFFRSTYLPSRFWAAFLEIVYYVHGFFIAQMKPSYGKIKSVWIIRMKGFQFCTYFLDWGIMFSCQLQVVAAPIDLYILPNSTQECPTLAV